MSEHAGWLLAGLLALSLLGQGWLIHSHRSGFSTLPIFVPVSLEYERQLRAQRQQPASRSGDQVLALAQALEHASLPPTTGATLKPRLTALFQTRLQLLEARGRRHELNVALMNVAVRIAQELRPDQWERIHMQRDALRARAEAEVFERVQAKLAQ